MMMKLTLALVSGALAVAATGAFAQSDSGAGQAVGTPPSSTQSSMPSTSAQQPYNAMGGADAGQQQYYRVADTGSGGNASTYSGQQYNAQSTSDFIASQKP
jgi:hypothetical protein